MSAADNHGNGWSPYSDANGHEFLSFGSFENAGTYVGDCESFEEAFEKSKLNFEVGKIPVAGILDPEADDPNDMMIGAPGMWLTYRTDTRAVLGQVGDAYQVVQQRDAFSFAEAMFYQTDGLKLSTAGIYRGGRRVWIAAELPSFEITRLDGVADPVKRFLFFSNGHDAKHPVRMALLPGRVWCSNMVNGVHRGITSEFTFRHVGADLDERLAEAQAKLMKASVEFEKMRGLFQSLASTRMSRTEFRTFAAEMLEAVKGRAAAEGEKANGKQQSAAARETLIDELTEYFEKGAGNTGESLWDGYNGVTEWLDHRVDRLAESARNRERYESNLISSVSGEDRRVKAKALAMLVKRAS